MGHDFRMLLRTRTVIAGSPAAVMGAPHVGECTYTSPGSTDSTLDVYGHVLAQCDAWVPNLGLASPPDWSWGNWRRSQY